jgi:hypothetical protein
MRVGKARGRAIRVGKIGESALPTRQRARRGVTNHGDRYRAASI